jgi:rod shape-determining protein MreD
MKILFLIAITFAVFSLQTSLAPLSGPGIVRPHLVLGGLVWIVWRAGPFTGLVTAAAWGLIADGLAQGPLGIDLVGFTLAAWIIQLVRERGPGGSAPRVGAVTGGVVFVVSVASVGVREFIERQNVDFSQLLQWAGGQAVATAILAIVLVKVGTLLIGPPADIGAAPTPRVSNRWRMLTE